ncbi:MAG: carboxypeptidase regulatory-like domain-containing protein [Vulcanimicrobiaceae bacterium]
MKWLALGLVLLLGNANGGGCSNPNAIGVQDYGMVAGRVLDATNNRPVRNALVSIGSLYTAYTDPDGGFTLTTIPIGTQTVTATAPGYMRASTDVHVVKNHTASAGYLRIVPVGNTRPTAPPPATPQPVTTPQEVPEETPSPTGSGAPAASPAPSTTPIASPTPVPSPAGSPLAAPGD